MSTRDVKKLPRYRYGPLESSDTVRLLRMLPSQAGGMLTVELYRFPLSSCPSYTALSYCWGDDSLERSAICNGARIDTTRSLYSLVDALRLYNLEGGRPYYWIDQICINQSDPREREAQVRIMGEIYRRAHACLVYLGEATEGAVQGFELVRKVASNGPASTEFIRNGTGRETYNLPPSGDPCWLTIQLELLLRPLRPKIIPEIIADRTVDIGFRRTWVVQEVCLATKVYLFMGGRRCTVLSLDELFNALSFIPLRVTGEGVSNSTLDKVKAAYDQTECVRSIRESSKPGRSSDLCASVGSGWLSECRDPRDKIYAMLGFLSASQASEIPVDYSMPWIKLYEHVALFLVSRGQGSEMLKYAGIDTTAAGSPSWVPNWNPPVTAPQRSSTFLSWGGAWYHAGGQVQAQVRLRQQGSVFMTRGAVFDTVKWTSRVAVSGGDYDDWYDDWHDTLRQELLTRFSRYRNGESITEAYQMTLIAAMGVYGERIDQNKCAEAYKAYHHQSWQKRGSSWKHYAYHQALVDLYWACFAWGTLGRRLCITSRGYIGLVPRNTKVGDDIIVMRGHKVPLILRSRGDKYVLVGECYIQGIMGGEALARPDARLEWISIH